MTAAATVSASQIAVEVGYAATPNALASQLAVEVGYTQPSQFAEASQIAIEVGYSDPTSNVVSASQLAVEVGWRGRPEPRTVRAWTFNLEGHSYYVLNLLTETLVYDQTTKQWAQWSSYRLGDTASPWRAQTGWNWGVEVIGGDDDIGLLWNIDPSMDHDNAPHANEVGVEITSILTGGLPQRLRASTDCAGVMLAFSAGYAAFVGATVTLETSDDQGATWISHGDVTLTLDPVQDVQWLSLGQVVQPGRVFRITDNGIARIDSLDFWSGDTPNSE